MDLDANAKPKSRRGFAAMGGASVPGEKRSFAKDRDLAASAGRKGGESSRGGGRTPNATTPPNQRG